MAARACPALRPAGGLGSVRSTGVHGPGPHEGQAHARSAGTRWTRQGAPQALVLHDSCSEREGDRLVLLNLGTGLDSGSCPQPLFAPPSGRRWRLLLSSDQARYGGMGTPPIPEDGRWPLPGQSALVLTGEEETKA
nr:DUF3459 domain-containing protein [Corallococcus sp. CA047B]